jgi:hypothetical protein
MIIKEKGNTHANNVRIAAGVRQELDVAFYLNRAFKEHPHVYVFNDLKLRHKGEVAQIDHLVVYAYGFIIIESKSITGEVSVNEHKEWSRSYNGSWQGMKSPIKQVDMQLSLLRDKLAYHSENLLDKLFGMLQKGFSGRQWDGICAISSNAIISRESMPLVIQNRISKSEFVTDRILALMNLPEKFQTRMKLMSNDNRVWFNESELKKICRFILASDESNKTDVQDAQDKRIAPDAFEQVILACKSCHSDKHLNKRFGKFGYYVNCTSCQVNTPMKQNCSSCGNKSTRVNKQKDDYVLSCEKCDTKKC